MIAIRQGLDAGDAERVVKGAEQFNAFISWMQDQNEIRRARDGSNGHSAQRLHIAIP